MAQRPFQNPLSIVIEAGFGEPAFPLGLGAGKE